METLESRDVPAGTLGTSTLLEGPTTGSDSVILTTTDTWAATSNASWLHTSASGTGNSLVTFTFDTNTGATRTGTLTIDGQTLTVTQAGSNYSAVNPLTTIASTGLLLPQGIAVDSSGNVYIADTNNNAVKKYNASTQTVTTFVSSGLNHPYDVAVDSSGNVYIADTSNNAVKEYNATGNLINTIAQSVQTPTGVAVDGAGNVYVVDQASNSVTEYNASGTLIATLPFTGLSQPTGVAVDSSGNVYVADTSNNRVEEYNASTQAVTTLASGLSAPTGVAVDGSGNVYVTTDYGNNAVKEYVAATQTVTTLASGLSLPTGVAVDNSGNVYFSNAGANTVQELVRAYVPTSPISLPNTVGSSQLAVVLPSTESLTGIFAPTSDQSWLTITGASSGIVSYSYTANTGTTARTAHITVLGQSITITQAATPVTPPVTSLSGVVFLDYNDNGVLDGGDTGVAGQTVFLDLHGDGTLDAGDPNTVTDANGNYTLNLLGVPVGNYTVEVQLTAVEQATGSPLIVTLPGAIPTNANLGVRPTSTIFPTNAGQHLSTASASASSSADIVQSLYVAYFGRPSSESTSSLLAAFGSSGTSTSSGSSAASSFLASSGASSGSSNFLALANDLSMSPEFLKYQVDSLYLTYLGRPADAGGEANFISQLQHGMDQRQVVILLVTSTEYTSAHADATDYVQSLFQKILGRAASASEISMYVQLLASGTSRAAVAQGILYSAEASEQTVEAFYVQFLQRKADPMGLANFASQLESGMNPAQVAVELLVSTEFINNATTTTPT